MAAEWHRWERGAKTSRPNEAPRGSGRENGRDRSKWGRVKNREGRLAYWEEVFVLNLGPYQTPTCSTHLGATFIENDLNIQDLSKLLKRRANGW